MAKETLDSTGGARRATAGESAYQSIKRKILTCAIEPGIDIREGELVEATGFGRTPIREALARLIHEGLVEVRPRQGYHVRDITVAGVREVHELRLLLEPAAIELAIARASDRDLQALHDLAYAEHVHTDEDTHEQFILDNREFHVRLAACGNKRLAAILEKLMEETQRLYFRSLKVRDSSGPQVREHPVLYEAVLARDSERAREICIQQVNTSHERVVEAMLRDLQGSALRVAHATLHARTSVTRRPRPGSAHL